MSEPETNFCALAGCNVQRARRAAGITQDALARKTGLNRTYLSDIERGLGNPSVKWLQDVAAALSMHPALLLLEAADADALRKILGKQRAGNQAAPSLSTPEQP